MYLYELSSISSTLYFGLGTSIPTEKHIFKDIQRLFAHYILTRRKVIPLYNKPFFLLQTVMGLGEASILHFKEIPELSGIPTILCGTTI